MRERFERVPGVTLASVGGPRGGARATMMKTDSGAIDVRVMTSGFHDATPSEELLAEDRRRIEGWLLAGLLSIALWVVLAALGYLVRAALT